MVNSHTNSKFCTPGAGVLLNYREVLVHWILYDAEKIEKNKKPSPMIDFWSIAWRGLLAFGDMDYRTICSTSSMVNSVNSSSEMSAFTARRFA